MNKKFIYAYYTQLASAILFSLFSVSFKGDISLLAFPLALAYTAVSVYIIFFKMIKNKDGKYGTGSYKLSEYLPFVLLLSFILRRAGNYGTPYWYDLITVILWTVSFVASLFIIYFMNAKRVKNSFKGFKNIPDPSKKPKGWKRLVYEIVDWIDAIVGAIFDVLLIQIFIVQLYVIPSESMVPQFLIKDRVAVSKINCGPKFPLTDIGLPDWGNYKRGDVVVLRNPHYRMDRKSEVKTVTSQLISMLTFMTVNLNTDENGEQKADPLVKRVAGVPGEQLVMQDGTLYARTKGDDEFKPVEKDAKYAAWNLNALPSSIKRQVETIPFTQSQYEQMLALEEERRNLDLNVTAIQAEELCSRFDKLKYGNLDTEFIQNSMYEYTLFANMQDFAARLMTSKNGSEWFTKFMTSWIEAKDTPKDMYSEANYRLNIMTKLCIGRIAVRYAELVRTGVASEEWKNDEEINKYYEKAELLNWYIQGLLDERNMCVFPANDKNGNPTYIPDNCFFMMGDNRFNSLDLRHSYDETMKPLSDYDSMSVQYLSFLEPQYLNKKYIIGKPFYTFWPVGRMGAVNKTRNK